MLVVGSDRTVDATAKLATRLSIPPFISGSLLLGLATSIPEALVTATATYQNAIELSVGNLLGSYCFNLCVVLGACALIRPISIPNKCLNRDIPIMGLSLLLVIILTIRGRFVKADAYILGLMFIFYLIFNVYLVRYDSLPTKINSPGSLAVNLGKLIVSFTIISIAAYMMVAAARGIALYFQVPEFIVGQTAVALGTSLPELSTSLTAQFKNEHDMAIGNIIGSNIYCLLLLLSIPIFVSTEPIPTETLWAPLMSMTVITFLFWVFANKFDDQKKINRSEASLLLLTYILHILILSQHTQFKITMIIS